MGIAYHAASPLQRINPDTPYYYNTRTGHAAMPPITPVSHDGQYFRAPEYQLLVKELFEGQHFGLGGQIERYLAKRDDDPADGHGGASQYLSNVGVKALLLGGPIDWAVREFQAACSTTLLSARPDGTRVTKTPHSLLFVGNLYSPNSSTIARLTDALGPLLNVPHQVRTVPPHVTMYFEIFELRFFFHIRIKGE